jgi:hypothetical protein
MSQQRASTAATAPKAPPNRSAHCSRPGRSLTTFEVQVEGRSVIALVSGGAPTLTEAWVMAYVGLAVPSPR